MNKLISPKITALTFGVLAISFLAAFYVVAWQEPTSAPPAGNVATPLNTGSAYQEKIGPLIINRGGATDGLIVEKGNVGIGIASPGAKLDVAGNIIASVPTVSSHVATKGYVDAQAGGGYSECYLISTGANTDCDTGYTTLITSKGYGCGRTGGRDNVIIQSGILYRYLFRSVSVPCSLTEYETIIWMVPGTTSGEVALARCRYVAYGGEGCPLGADPTITYLYNTTAALCCK